MKSRTWATAGSVVSAVASSACCWLPLLMVATGSSAVAAAAFFGRFRPLFLAVAVVLLAIGFYLNYRSQREKCGPDGSCSVRNGNLRRLNRGMLWFSAALVLVFALFPSYVGSLVGISETSAAANKSGTTEELVLGIRGMTCAGCEAATEAALASIPGVLAVTASFENEQAVITLDRSAVPERIVLAAAVGRAGYELTSVEKGEKGNRPKSTGGHWVAELEVDDGETAILIVDLGQVGSRLVGEFDLPKFNVENYPVDASLSESTVRLHFTALALDFTGALAEDGETLSGTATQGEESDPVEFRRTGEAQFSATFLELEAAADDPSVLEELSSRGSELRQQFNTDSNKTRLLMLLAPT